MAIKSVLLPQNIIDLIICAVATIHNFFKDCEVSYGLKKERNERWNKGESNGCWGKELKPTFRWGGMEDGIKI